MYKIRREWHRNRNEVRYEDGVMKIEERKNDLEKQKTKTGSINEMESRREEMEKKMR